MLTVPVEPASLREFHEQLKNDTLKGCKIACYLIFAIYPGFYLLDLVMVPREQWPLFGLVRISLCLSTAVVLLMIRSLRARLTRYADWLGVYLALSTGLSILWMVMRLGSTSSYYSGICLVMFGYAMAIPTRLRYCLFTTGFLLISYLLSIGLLSHITDLKIFINNSVFLISNLIFAVAMTQLNYVFRRKNYFAARSLEETMQSLARTNERIVKITAQAAHDIRGPLTSLNAAVRYWKENPPPENDYVTMLDLSAKRLHSIANEVLDQHGPRKKGIFSLHRLLDELIGEHSAGSNGILFKKQYGEALSVAGNRDRLQRAFGNIIKNAVEAMNGKGALSLKTTSQDGHAVIEIADTGPGMPPEILKKVLRGGFTSKKEGHGIGMEVVREVVEEHQGKIEADSIVGRGTTFRIKLPLPDSLTLKESEAVEEGAGQFELKAAKGEQIVVIDDDPSAQLQWELILRKLGLEPLTYESFEDYQKKSTTRPTNLKIAIVDYHFDNSELNGFEIITKLREEGYTNVMLCTGEYWKPAVREEAKKMGVPICSKPIPKVVVRGVGGIIPSPEPFLGG